MTGFIPFFLPLPVALQPLLMIGQFLLVAGVSFAIICAITSVVRFQLITRDLETKPEEDIDPEDLFQMSIVKRFGKHRAATSPFTVLLVDLCNRAEFSEEEQREAREILSEALKNALRKTDTLGRYGDDIGIIVDSEKKHISTIATRVMKTVGKNPYRFAAGVNRRFQISMGAASFPEDSDRAQELVQQARRALEEARTRSPESLVLPPSSAEDENTPAEEEPPQVDKRLIDEVSGVLRSDRVENAMQKYMANQRRKGKSVSLLYLGPDNVTRYTNQYGSRAEEAILRGLGGYLQDHTREDDLIGRYAGDEFLIMMVAKPMDALIAAQRLVADIRKSDFRMANTRMRLTVSMGIAGSPDHGNSPRQLFHGASTALKNARETGRGMAVIYDPSMVVSSRASKEKRTVY